ncbi:thioesterase [Sulfurimonas hongkongensis]|uniref:Thioesterase n=1 Tax=Sulfurimonas hongkongensis TaxID=1172190 RepID=T0JBN2_9BACT|nr:hotdog domain-containing protein [Sulfurimonas hongkongensis]EQB35486.1 thioesterase [Sulfurimonas hongkongensis]
MNEENDKDLELDDYREDEQNSVVLNTHENINRDLCGEIMRIEQGYVELRLTTSTEMVADEQGLIHGGFIFGAADFAAMAAVNEKNVVLVGSESHFLSPVKFGDEVNFVARVRHKEGRKRNVYVEAHVLDIKIFHGEFRTVITEKHVLKLKLLDAEES